MSADNGAIPIDLDDSPAENFAKTLSGKTVDLNNLPGKVRQELIDEGEMSIESFVSPANMPGKKLKEMRERFAKNIEDQRKKSNAAKGIKDTEDAILDFKVGELIIFKEISYEVKGVDPVKGLKITKDTDNGPKNVWVQPINVKKVEIDDRSGDEGRGQESTTE